jgi:hypothetical protein
MTLPSRFTFLVDTYISEECTVPIFKASTLMMEALCSFRMLVPTYRYTTQCHNHAYSNLGIHHCENYKFHTLILSVTNIHKSFLRKTTLYIIQNTARAYYNLLILASTNVSSSCTKRSNLCALCTQAKRQNLSGVLQLKHFTVTVWDEVMQLTIVNYLQHRYTY